MDMQRPQKSSAIDPRIQLPVQIAELGLLWFDLRSLWADLPAFLKEKGINLQNIECHKKNVTIGEDIDFFDICMYVVMKNVKGETVSAGDIASIFNRELDYLSSDPLSGYRSDAIRDARYGISQKEINIKEYNRKAADSIRWKVRYLLDIPLLVEADEVVRKKEKNYKPGSLLIEYLHIKSGEILGES